jgi:hypothetical protein
VHVLNSKQIYIKCWKIGKPEGRRSIGRTRCTYGDNIEMNLWEVGYGNVH